jgi:hypothetical protein
MHDHRPSANTIALRGFLATAMLAIVVVLSITLASATLAQAPIVQSLPMSGSPTATVTAQTCSVVCNNPSDAWKRSGDLAVFPVVVADYTS